jgi:arginyl-tRNA--protein-N-Asp/Glu arginylyltransferase
MKFFSSELAHDYGSYTFGYANYAQLEPGDSLAELYGLGYLPYSGARDIEHTLYMARSARVLLKKFCMTSENRRIAKKFDGRFTKERVPIGQFNADEDFYAFCLAYFAERHGSRAMPRERLDFIMRSPFISHIIVYSQAGAIIGYAFELREGDSAHYWYSFYDLSFVRESLGLWLMLDCVRDAAEAGLEYYYLGTLYGEKALYKTNFEPLEWWSGQAWESDIKRLRERSRSDESRVFPHTDAWKRDHDFF